MHAMREESLQVKPYPGSSPDVLVIQLTGPLLCQNLFDFQQTVRTTQTRALIIDMTQVPFIDSAGVGALVGAYVSFQKNDRRLALVGVNDRVTSLLSMTQVDRFFHSYGTVAQAEHATGTSSSNAVGQT